MARIRVNTEDLKNKAKDFDSAADALKRAGDEILAEAMSMPSYDGQLSGSARKAGYEIQKELRELSTNFAGDAESLRSTAKAFEDVDNQAITSFDERLAQLSESPLYPKGGKPRGLAAPLLHPVEPPTGGALPISSGGNHVLGYEDYGDYIILWKDGKSIRIEKNDQNKEMIQNFIESVDKFCENCAEIFKLINDMLMEALAILPAIIFFLSSRSIVILDYLKVKYPEFKVILEFADKLMGLIGISSQDIIKILGFNIYEFKPIEFGDQTKELIRLSDLANTEYSEAVAIFDALAKSVP